jgi:hypothetical protein
MAQTLSLQNYQLSCAHTRNNYCSELSRTSCSRPQVDPNSITKSDLRHHRFEGRTSHIVPWSARTLSCRPTRSSSGSQKIASRTVEGLASRSGGLSPFCTSELEAAVRWQRRRILQYCSSRRGRAGANRIVRRLPAVVAGSDVYREGIG